MNPIGPKETAAINASQRAYRFAIRKGRTPEIARRFAAIVRKWYLENK